MHIGGTSRHTGWLPWIVGIWLGAASGAALAQQADPPAPAPFTLPAAPAISGPGLGVATPVVVQRLRFEGLRSLPEAELQAAGAPFLNRPLRALDLEELRQRITRVLVDRGFVNSGALLPDAALDQGTLTLRIVEGQVTRVQLQGMQRLDDAYLASRLVRPGEPFNVNTLQERFQLLLADPLFTRLNARLLPDEGLGRAVLDIDVTRARPWQLGLFANNHLAPAVGSTVGGIDGSIRNITGWGDTLSATLYGSDGTVSHDASWALPLFGRSTVATLRLARTHASVIEEKLETLDIKSLVGVREFGIAQPVIDSARQRLAISLTHSLRHNAVTYADGGPFDVVTGGPSGSTQLEAWRLSQDYTLRLDRHVLALRASYIRGRNNVPPANNQPLVPPPRYGLWQLQTQAALALGDGDAQLLLRGQAQHSPQHLVSLEQMAIGGRHTVRGYRENTLVRDNAWAASAELHWPLWRNDDHRAAVKLVPFVDAGAAWNRDEDRRRLASAGLGLVLTLADFEAELFYGRRLEHRPTNTRGDLQDHGLHLALRYRPF